MLDKIRFKNARFNACISILCFDLGDFRSFGKYWSFVMELPSVRKILNTCCISVESVLQDWYYYIWWNIPPNVARDYESTQLVRVKNKTLLGAKHILRLNAARYQLLTETNIWYGQWVSLVVHSALARRKHDAQVRNCCKPMWKIEGLIFAASQLRFAMTLVTLLWLAWCVWWKWFYYLWINILPSNSSQTKRWRCWPSRAKPSALRWRYVLTWRWSHHGGGEGPQKRGGARGGGGQAAALGARQASGHGSAGG